MKDQKKTESMPKKSPPTGKKKPWGEAHRETLKKKSTPTK